MGKRGEGWFVLQMVLFGVIALAPRGLDVVFPLWLRALGAALLLLGGLFGTWGMVALGRNLTPYPKPIDDGELVTQGPYCLVRHPIYAGLILATLGWGLWRASALGATLAVVMLVFFDLKSRREEQWLAAAYAGYAAYQRRVRKLIPWVY